MENFAIKEKFDPIFDELCSTKEFKNAMMKEFGYCPNGLTIDTRYNESKDDTYFVVCCKEYGYEYRGEKVVGDYKLLPTKINDKMFQFIIQYVADNLEPNIVEELNTYEGFIN